MFQEVNGATLHYGEYGTGERYILSAQSGFDLDEKGWPMDLADEGFHVFTIQIRGYGKSTHVTEDLGADWYDTWADDVYEFARRKGIARFLYTGQSHGAGIGWHLCLRHPEVVAGFAALVGGPHARKGGEVSPGRLETIRSAGDPAARIKAAEGVRGYYLSLASRFADDPERRAEYEGKAQKAYDAALQATPEELRLNPRKPLASCKTDEEAYALLSEIDLPVLMINGQQDSVVPVTDILWPIRVIRHAKCIIYHDADHSIHDDCRPEIRKDIARFAAEVFSTETRK